MVVPTTIPMQMLHIGAKVQVLPLVSKTILSTDMISRKQDSLKLTLGNMISIGNINMDHLCMTSSALLNTRSEM